MELLELCVRGVAAGTIQMFSPAGVTSSVSTVFSPAPKSPFLAFISKMERRRSQFKSTAIAKKPMYRPKYTRAISAVAAPAPRLFRSLAAPDRTVTVLNAKREQSITITRTIGSAGFGFAAATAAGSGLTAVFDPSGTYSGYNGTASGSIAGMPDWAALITIYDQYKVVGIKLHWRALSASGSISDQQSTILQRYNYESSVVLPTASGMRQLTRCIQKTFSAESPDSTYGVYPKVLGEVVNSGILSAQSHQVKSMGWTDVNYPAQIFGFQAVAVDGTTANVTLACDVEYTVQFRKNK